VLGVAVARSVVPSDGGVTTTRMVARTRGGDLQLTDALET